MDALHHWADPPGTSRRWLPRALPRVLALVLTSGAGTITHGGATQTGYSVELLGGYDSNPLRVADDGPDSAFTELRLGGALTHDVSPSVSLFTSGDAHRRFHESGTASADEGNVELRAGVALAPDRLTSGRLALAIGATYGLYDTTFIDPQSGEVYRAFVVPESDPPVATPVPDRLNNRYLGGFAKVRWRYGPSLSLTLDLQVDRVAFDEDYSGTTDLDPLDHRVRTIEPGVRWELMRSVSVAYSMAWTDFEYEARPALDAAGAPVADTARAYRYLQHRVTLRARPAERWMLWTGMAHADRQDTYAGYYDHRALTAYAGADWSAGAKSRVRLYAQVRELDYDRATVDGDPAGEVRTGEAGRLIARFERGWTRHLSWFVEAGRQREDGNDVIFAHERNWSIAGLRLER
jgi:hypothetical protein